ncbi:protein kinase domain-containing protein [Kribbella alba]|uniref:protein kinase domain-containing protein n=1 Tax=Kribbella alba TaxID=190197 RepID=UPI0031D8098D
MVEKVYKQPADTGGNFSVNYWVENEQGGRAFCKVLDLEWILKSRQRGSNLVDALTRATQAYQFERDLARMCVSMSRVITALDDGEVEIEGDYAFPTVSYIIFEAAGKDIRKLLNLGDELDVPLRLRALHHLATGINQLHTNKVAHQDVKPSNTLVFEPDFTGNRVTKLGDLGRATVHGRPAEHDNLLIAGDRTYAPPEALYGKPMEGIGPRRFAVDLYQLGSMICYVFTSVSFNALLRDELHPEHIWGNWGQSYDDVLPFVRDAFGRALERLAEDVPKSIKDDVYSLVSQLCDPDPMRRGHAKTRSMRGNPYALQRIVTELDVLARKAAMELRS